jgi:hypothetical protein
MELMPKWFFISGTEFDRSVIVGLTQINFDSIEEERYPNSKNRRRCGARAKLLPDNERLEWQQPDIASAGEGRFVLHISRHANPEYSGSRRSFQWFPEALRSSEVFGTIVSTVARRLPIRQLGEIEVALQIISYGPTFNVSALATPNHVHRDEVGWTSVSVLDKVNLEGGRFWICEQTALGDQIETVKESSILFNHALERPMDTVVFDDRAVAHHVSAMRRADPHRIARRCVLLIDYLV